MNHEHFNAKAGDIWKQEDINPAAKKTNLQLELDFYKTVLHFFQVGEYYYFIFNLYTVQLEVVQGEIEKITGYEPSEMTMDLFLGSVHEDDRPWFLEFENKAREFFSELPVEKLTKYKVRYDFRFRKKNGDYVRLLQQAVAIEHDDEGHIIRSLGVHTDISHLKTSGRPVLSFIGLDGEPSYIDVDIKNIFVVSKEALSKREKEVLLLIMDGKVSKEISEILHISKQTVDSHRNNMIARNNLNNTSELIAKAVREGWL